MVNVWHSCLPIHMYTKIQRNEDFGAKKRSYGKRIAVKGLNGMATEQFGCNLSHSLALFSLNLSRYIYEKTVLLACHLTGRYALSVTIATTMKFRPNPIFKGYPNIGIGCGTWNRWDRSKKPNDLSTAISQSQRPFALRHMPNPATVFRYQSLESCTIRVPIKLFCAGHKHVNACGEWAAPYWAHTEFLISADLTSTCQIDHGDEIVVRDAVI